MVSQLLDLSKETLISLFTMSTQKDGSSVGLYLLELEWSVSGSTFQAFTSMLYRKVLMTKTSSD